MTPEQFIIEEFLEWMLNETEYVIAEQTLGASFPNLEATSNTNDQIIQQYLDYLKQHRVPTEESEAITSHNPKPD